MNLIERLEFYYNKVDLDKFIPEKPINFNIYIKQTNNFILYKDRNFNLTKIDINRLKDKGIKSVYIHKKEKKSFKTYIEENIDRLLDSDNVDIKKKSEALFNSTVNVIEDIFKNPRSGKSIKRSKKLISNSVDFIMSEPEAFVNLLKIKKYDYYTYTHSVNVCIFLISLAQEMGVNDQKTLKEIGEGGLLHDLGKSMISPKIINKQGKLTDKEWEIMKNHPAYGVKIIKDSGREISPISLSIIGQHHEKLDGRGYPLGLNSSELSSFVKMSTIVDIYDAVTTNRSYSKARTPFEGIEILLKNKNSLDNKILLKFIKMLGVKGKGEKNEKSINKCV